MNWGALLTFLVCSALRVVVTPTEGQPYEAEWIRMGDANITLDVAGQTREVPIESLSRIERAEESDANRPLSSVGLIDGSVLAVERVEVSDGKARLALRRQGTLEVPLKQVAWIRYRRPSNDVNEAWRGMLAQDSANDRLVIRRDGAVLDQVAGVVDTVTESTVNFVVGSNNVAAPVERLEGVLFGGVKVAENRGLALVDVFGSVWAAKKLLPSEPGGAGEAVRFEASSGETRSLPLELLSEIRFADTALRLASSEPVDRSYQPLVEAAVDEQRLAAWLGPRVIDGDLVLRSRSSVTYRLEPGYRVLALEVSPDRSVAAGTGAVVRIKLDERVVWEQQVAVSDDPRGLEIPVENARRVTFEVDFGEGTSRGDAGDVIRFARPRLVQ